MFLIHKDITQPSQRYDVGENKTDTWSASHDSSIMEENNITTGMKETLLYIM